MQPLANQSILSVRPRDGGTWAVGTGVGEPLVIAASTESSAAGVVRVDREFTQVAVAGQDQLLVFTATLTETRRRSFDYAAAAVVWADDGRGLIAAPAAGGLDYLSFTGGGTTLQSAPLGFAANALDVVVVPGRASLFVRPATNADTAALRIDLK